jgi:hypothetical protein
MNTSTCLHNPINLTIIDIDSPTSITLMDSPAYSGYIPQRKDNIAIRSIAYQVREKMVEYKDTHVVRVVIGVTRLIHTSR